MNIFGSLNYIFLNKNQRSNSYLENYNRRIKEILGLFLTKIGRTIIPWPLFISFIRNEEEYYNKLIKDLLDSEQKYNKYKNIVTNYVPINENDNVKKSFWLSYQDNSCRYDSFLLIFFTTIYNIFKDNNHYIPSNNINDLLHLTDIIIDILRQQKIHLFWIYVNQIKIIH